MTPAYGFGTGHQGSVAAYGYSRGRSIFAVLRELALITLSITKVWKQTLER